MRDIMNLSDDEFEAAFSQEVLREDEPEQVETIEEEPNDGVQEAEEEIEVVNEDDSEDEEILEQPSEDSDDDGTDKAAEGDVESDSKDEEPTGEADNEQTEDKKPEVAAEVQPVRKRVYKANGKEFEFTEAEALAKFGDMFAQSMNYTQKMQAIAPYKKMISAMEDEKLTQDDMNLMIDVLKGDKDAIAAVLKRTGVDALDIDTDENKTYQPNSYGRNETELAIKDVVDSIKNDTEYRITHNVIEAQWDDESREAFVKNPKLIRELHRDVQSGVYNKVSPLMEKMKYLDGGQHSDIDYYVEAGRQYYAGQNAQKIEADRVKVLGEKTARAATVKQELERVKGEENKRKEVAQKSADRRKAAPTAGRSGKQKLTDYLNTDRMSDDEFSAFMDKELK